MVTIKQVAAHAGVSFKTVSRVVNHDSTVKDVNREKVLKAIKELGYRPNRAASLTRRKNSNIYAIIADELLSVPYTFDIIRGAQEIAWKTNKELLILNVNDSQESIDRAIESLLEYRVEGVIYSAMYHRAVQVSDELKKIPTILANCFPVDNNLPCVVPDEVQAGEEIASALINKGYRRIAFLNLNEDIVAAKGRKEGVIKAFKQHGLPLSDLLIESVIVTHNDGVERSTSRESAARIIDNFKPDAIICGQDPMAIEIYFVVHDKGMIIGEDIGIASFDNWGSIPELLQPNLTTMALPHHEMGRWAMEYLIACRTDIVHQHLPFKLIKRDSF
ncbi:LacI family DNA-binding transcriptional regulator [Pseudoalteromonas sp. SR44-2]|jgi:LacI family transcriptional regulator|uniref:LacI family DNA-binding transcriptional regulator n=1 Tax=Pseudoalteromonas sp. SR44-2 TaxID=2760937 RepID=UPI0016038FFD|nr:LacI family DNA-binding transcriptional regulator [Pseudoalteromonas sp. SR44-2]MBB1339435.1 LacI family DNA-binding transcriptional regulator [Pseudoalteromonas sp. SR44-2]